MSQKQKWIPEIMYEEAQDGEGSQIPFIMVPESEDMPQMLYIFESRETGEFEPGSEGEEVPVIEWDLHQYADMSALKNNLSPVEYDNVRYALGLEPLVVAMKKVAAITERVRDNISEEK